MRSHFRRASGMSFASGLRSMKLGRQKAADDSTLGSPGIFHHGRGIDTPTGGERSHLFGVHVHHFTLRVIQARSIRKTSQPQFLFSRGDRALVPGRLAGPGVGTENLATIDNRPRVLVQCTTGAKVLQVTDFTAEVGEEMNTVVDIIAW